jgi:hypothetical protein
MLSLCTLSLAFSVLTLLIVGGLAFCWRQRMTLTRRAVRDRAGSEPTLAGTATMEE